MYIHTWQALGTNWKLTLWDELSVVTASLLASNAEALTHEFDALYSRFKPNSLVTKLATTIGTIGVPPELVAMLRHYEKLYEVTDGKINPTIGFALEDTGYDANYSLVEQSVLRPVHALPEALTIIDDTQVMFFESVLLDLGALGKGYLIDMVYKQLREAGVERFLIDGSGDIRYYSESKEPIVCGLEDPRDAKQVIGTLTITEGSLCASATNRRHWGNHRHHYLDPHTNKSPRTVLATWVYAPEAAIADGLASALFFVSPESLVDFYFEYLVVNHEMRIKKSAGFAADFFVESV